MNKLRYRFFNKTAIMAFVLSAAPWSAWSDPNSIYDDPWFAQNVVKRLGTERPKEVLEWKKDPKDLPSDWLKLKNKKFTISYPKCIYARGSHELYEYPENSDEVDFLSDKCPALDKTLSTNGLGIYGDLGAKGMLKANNDSFPTFLVQDIKINGMDARMFVVAYPEGERLKENIQLSWRIYAECKGKGIYFITSAAPGEQTVKLIEKKNYQFPEFFKKIVETFECK